MQNLNLSNQINIAMRKETLSQLTVGMLSSNVNEKVKHFIASDQTFTFMNSIKGTPAYWKKLFFDDFAMVKQLRVPTFFVTLVCFDTLFFNTFLTLICRFQIE